MNKHDKQVGYLPVILLYCLLANEYTQLTELATIAVSYIAG